MRSVMPAVANVAKWRRFRLERRRKRPRSVGKSFLKSNAFRHAFLRQRRKERRVRLERRRTRPRGVGKSFLKSNAFRHACRRQRRKERRVRLARRRKRPRSIGNIGKSFRLASLTSHMEGTKTPTRWSPPRGSVRALRGPQPGTLSVLNRRPNRSELGP